MNKKILFFCSVTKIGGAETNIVKISNELNKLGFEVHFATLEDNGPMFTYCKDYGKSFTEIGLFTKHPINAIKKYAHLLKTEKFDVVFNFGLRVEIFSRLVTKFVSSRTRSVANIRSTNSFRKFHQIWLDRCTSFLVDTWVSNSVAGKNIYTKREKINRQKIKVIYNYIEPIVGLVENDFVKTKSPIKIGVLANIRKLKGHYDLIPLTYSLLDVNIIPQFILAGSDNSEGDFQLKVTKNKLEKYFDFRGYTEDKDSFFSSIDIFLLPSYIEGMPTSVLEAMAYNKPIVTTDIDGIPEQIENGVNGFALPPGDIVGFTRAIVRIINDDYLRNKFIDRNKKIIATTFSKQEKINDWVKVIME